MDLDSTSSQMGSWELLGELASGAMGTVYLARGRTNDRVAAVKKIHPHLEREVAFVRMFMDEARLARHIASRHVVETYELLEESGRHAIAMRYVEGGSLSMVLRECHAQRLLLPHGIALRIVHDTLLGLEAVHEATGPSGERLDIVHRDVSPQNILLDMEGYAQLTDFGVAHARGRLQSTRGQQIKGKLRYLAPEQLRGGPLDRRVDIFAAGIVLWELLTGKQLFDADNDVDVMRLVVTMPVAPPTSAGARVPLALDRVCLRALSRDPARRFATAQEFADAIEELGLLAPREDVVRLVRHLFGETTSRQRRRLSAPVKRPRRRTKRAVLVGIGAVLAMGGAGTWWHLRKPPMAQDVAAPAQVTIPPVPASAEPSSPQAPLQTQATPATPRAPASTPVRPPASKPSARSREPARTSSEPSPSASAPRQVYIPESL